MSLITLLGVGPYESHWQESLALNLDILKILFDFGPKVIHKFRPKFFRARGVTFPKNEINMFKSLLMPYYSIKQNKGGGEA